MIAKVSDLGQYLVTGIRKLSSKNSLIGEIRGMGLMIGVQIGPQAKDVVNRLLEKGIIANAAHETVLRLLPPFIITREDIDEFLSTLDVVLGEVKSGIPTK